jgi:hypothetical protein
MGSSANGAYIVPRLAADADRGSRPRDQERPWKAARPDNTGATEARVIARGRTAASGKVSRCGPVGAGDWRGGSRAGRHRARGQPQDDEEDNQSHNYHD